MGYEPPSRPSERTGDFEGHAVFRGWIDAQPQVQLTRGGKQVA
jgi:hypothetical protein